MYVHAAHLIRAFPGSGYWMPGQIPSTEECSLVEGQAVHLISGVIHCLSVSQYLRKLVFGSPWSALHTITVACSVYRSSKGKKRRDTEGGVENGPSDVT